MTIRSRIPGQQPARYRRVQQPRQQHSHRLLYLLVALLVLVAFGIGGVYVVTSTSYAASQRQAHEYVCSLTYERYSTEWQNCVDA